MFSSSESRRLSHQQQLNVKMFAGSQTKPWGDSVSTDGALFCSVETASAHADFHTTICRLLLAPVKFAGQTCSYTFIYTGKVGWAHSAGHADKQHCLVSRYNKINQLMWQEQTERTVNTATAWLKSSAVTGSQKYKLPQSMALNPRNNTMNTECLHRR